MKREREREREREKISFFRSVSFPSENFQLELGDKFADDDDDEGKEVF